MTQHLPCSNIKLNNDISVDDVIKTSDDADIGYMLEVDISFPPAIHELLKQVVPCPENIIPTQEWFSEYHKELQNKEHMITQK